MIANRWPLPKPVFAADDSELFLVNVLLSAIREIALDSLGSGATTEEGHLLFMKLVHRGYKSLVTKRTYLTEDGVEDMLKYLRKDIE